MDWEHKAGLSSQRDLKRAEDRWAASPARSGAGHFLPLDEITVPWTRRRAANIANSMLWSLIKAKFVGYFQWTAFAMLLTPIAFWVFSLK